MRLAYLGSPAAAVVPLRALVAAGHDVVLVVSNPDRRRSRGGRPVPTPVKAAATELGIPVTDRVDDVVDAGAELGVVVAFGQLIRPHVLEGLPMVNLHFSLLPRWRGAAPVERAILAGDTRTGVCLMEVEEGLDTGGVYACREVPIEPHTTAEALRARLVEVGTDLLVEQLGAGLGTPVPQPEEGVTYAAKLAAEDLRIDWSAPCSAAHARVRVGGAWTTFRGDRLKVLEAEPASGGDALAPGELRETLVGCGDGALSLRLVQPAGRRAVPAGDWVRGARPGPGERLG